jgi:hypothetical protein
MCSAESYCGSRGACVAGRCVLQGATAAIDNARRLLFAPVDTAYVRRSGGDGDAGQGPIATFGRGRDGDAVALLRFAARVPPEATVLEAYLLLQRATDVDADPVPITLHALPVRDAWDGHSASWATLPRTEEVGAPITRVLAADGPFVRLDVREIVQRWRRRGYGEFGIAVVSEGSSATGVSFVWAPGAGSADRWDPTLGRPAVSAEPPSPFEPRAPPPGVVGDARSQRVGPRLEVYVR